MKAHRQCGCGEWVHIKRANCLKCGAKMMSKPKPVVDDSETEDTDTSADGWEYDRFKSLLRRIQECENDLARAQTYQRVVTKKLAALKEEVAALQNQEEAVAT